jgi:hypothetical protein
VQKSAVQIEKKSQPEVDFRPTFWRLETKTWFFNLNWSDNSSIKENIVQFLNN